MSEKYYEVCVTFPSQLKSIIPFVQQISTAGFGCGGIEEYVLEEDLIDATLGDKARASMNISLETLQEMEEKYYMDQDISCKFYFYQDDPYTKSKDFCLWLNSNYDHLKVVLDEKDYQDWNEKWKESFSPILISNLIEIVPSWQFHEYESSAKYPISIYPGRGFGTGNHETTELCLKYLSELSESEDLEGRRLLDFGCGSGILGIAAGKLGAKKVTLYDIDEEALENCRLNVENNFVDYSAFMISSEIKKEDSTKGGYEVVVGNILLDVLKEEKETIISLLKKDGFLIVSGLLLDQIDDLVSDYTGNAPLSYISSMTKGDWGALLFKKEK